MHGHMRPPWTCPPLRTTSPRQTSTSSPGSLSRRTIPPDPGPQLTTSPLSECPPADVHGLVLIHVNDMHQLNACKPSPPPTACLGGTMPSNGCSSLPVSTMPAPKGLHPRRHSISQALQRSSMRVSIVAMPALKGLTPGLRSHRAGPASLIHSRSTCGMQSCSHGLWQAGPIWPSDACKPRLPVATLAKVLQSWSQAGRADMSA